MKATHAFSFALALLLGTASASAAAGGPDGKTAQLLNFWKTNGAEGMEGGGAPLPPELADIFDYDELTDSAISPHKKQFNDKQLGRYSKTFGNLLRRTVHARAGRAIGKTDYKVAKSKKAGKNREVEVSAYLPDEDITTSVVFVWEQTKLGWQIVDVRIDDASLVNDYRNQFGRMIGKDGVDGFITKLERRLDAATGNG
ncbi:MAG: ABC transporter substrate-binding protein [Myxococcota bacterium]